MFVRSSASESLVTIGLERPFVSKRLVSTLLTPVTDKLFWPPNPMQGQTGQKSSPETALGAGTRKPAHFPN